MGAGSPLSAVVLVAVAAQGAVVAAVVVVVVEVAAAVEELIAEEMMVVTFSRGGYVKRVPLDAYRAQGRGGRAIPMPSAARVA